MICLVVHVAMLLVMIPVLVVPRIADNDDRDADAGDGDNDSSEDDW